MVIFWSDFLDMQRCQRCTRKFGVLLWGSLIKQYNMEEFIGIKGLCLEDIGTKTKIISWTSLCSSFICPLCLQYVLALILQKLALSCSNFGICGCLWKQKALDLSKTDRDPQLGFAINRQNISKNGSTNFWECFEARWTGEKSNISGRFIKPALNDAWVDN